MPPSDAAPSDDRLDAQLAFLLEAEKLRRVERRNYVLGTDRHENSAEHSWHFALLALVLAEHANEPVDVAKVVAMALIHDLGEIDAGDVFVYADAATKRDHQDRERAGLMRLAGLLPADQGAWLRHVWEEFEDGDTPEARFARALDRFHPMYLNFIEQGRVWREVGVTAERVLAVNAHMNDGSETLWARAKRFLGEAVRKKFLEP